MITKLCKTKINEKKIEKQKQRRDRGVEKNQNIVNKHKYWLIILILFKIN